LQEDATTGLHDVLQSITKAASGVTYAVSFYVKQGVGTRNLKIQVDDAGSGNGMSYVVTPTTGAIVAGPTMIGAGWASVGAMTYTALPNGWGRFAFVVSTAATTTFRILLLLATGTNQSYAGDNTSTIQLYGFQVEAASMESSYIPTTTVAVTRAAEFCSLPTGAWFNASASSLAVDYMLRQSPNPSTGGRHAVGLGDGTLNNRMVLIGQNASSAAATTQTTVASSSTVPSSLGSPVANAVSKLAAAWGGGSVLGALNGGSVLTTAVGMPAGITTLFIGTSYTGVNTHLNGHVRRVRYWPLALAPADLQAVTA
jgi:hypothetical protein